MENKTVIGFIGAGNMAYALIKGLLSDGFEAKNINVSDANLKLLEKRSSELGVTTYSDNVSLLTNSDIVVFAVNLKYSQLFVMSSKIRLHQISSLSPL